MILLSCFQVLSSQEFSATNYSISDGLPSSECYHITQDQRGYIWIATDRGPCRFDGEKFKTYGIKEGLPDPTIFRIIPIGDTILFRSYSETIYALIKDSIYLLPIFEKLKKEIKGNDELINGIGLDNNNELRVGLLSFSGSTSYFQFEGLNNYERVVVHQSPKRSIYWNYLLNDGSAIASQYVKYSNSSVIFAYDSLPPRTYSLSTLKNQVDFGLQVLSTKKNKPLVFYNNYVYSFYNNALREITTLKGPHNIGSAINLDSNTVMIGVKNQPLIKIYETDDGWKTAELNNFYSISDCFIDNEKNLWLSSLYSGVYLAPNKGVLKIYSNLERKEAVALAITDEKLFVGMINGEIYEYDKRNNFKLLKKQRIGETLFDMDISRDSLWVSCIRFDTSIYGLNNDHMHIYHSSGAISSLGDDQNIWTGGSRTSRYFDTKTHSFQNYPVPEKTHQITEFKEDTFLLATGNGILTAILRNGKFLILKKCRPHTRISFIKKISKNYALIGTIGQGILLFEFSSNSIIINNDETIRKRIVNVNHIAPGAHNTYWVSTNSGIAVIKADLEKQAIKLLKTINTSNGLASNKINQIKFDNKNAYIVTEQEVAYLDSSASFINEYQPPIFVNDVAVFGDTNFSIHQYQELSWNHNNLKIEYIGLSYKTGTGANYSYRLLGNSNESILTKESNASFLNLRPGNYQFEVSAINNSGVRSLKPAVFNFIILPPFYKTWWFYSLIIFFTLLLIYLFYRLKIKRLNAKNKNEIEFNELRQKALIAQMNPHFIFNSMNSILSLIMENRNEIAEDYLTRFAGLLRNALNQSEAAYTTLREELMISKEYIRLENMRFSFSITCKVNIAEDIEQNKTLVPSLLLQTLAENAILHGITPAQKDGIIKLNVTKKNEHLLLIQIIDNGIGLEASKKLKPTEPQTHGSKGTNILIARVEALAQIHNLDCSIEFKDTGAGTEVNLCVPYSIYQDEKKHIIS